MRITVKLRRREAFARLAERVAWEHGVKGEYTGTVEESAGVYTIKIEAKDSGGHHEHDRG